MNTKLKKILFILFVLILLSLGYLFSHLLTGLEDSSQNWKQHSALNLWQSRNKSSEIKDNIIILSIDDLTSFDLTNHSSLNFSGWPLSRAIWAESIDFIEKGKPKVLAFAVPFENYEDVTLSENSPDVIFSNTLKKYNNIVLGTNLYDPYLSAGKNSAYTPREMIQPQFKPINKSLNVAIDDQDAEARLTYFSYSSIPNIFVNKAQIGYLNLKKGPDSVVRYSQPIARIIAGNTISYMPSFAFASFLKYINYDGPIKVAKSKLQLKQYSIPFNVDGSNLINWNGVCRTYTFIPFSKILIGMRSTGNSFDYNKKVYPVDYFKDKIVIVSPTQTYVDTYKTPVDKDMSAAEIYANIIDNYITDAKLDNLNRRKFVRDIPLYVSILIALAFASLIVANALLFRTSFLSLFNSVLLVLLYIFFDIFAFVHPKIRLNFILVYPLFLMFVAIVSSYVYVLNDENVRKKEIIGLLGNSVSNNVLKILLKNPNNFNTKPKKKRITTLYCDVSSFSGFIDKHSEEEVIGKLNSIFTIVTDKVFKYNGTVDRFINDALLAYWGDPLESTTDSLSAVKAAVEILKEIEELNESLVEEDLKLNVKISIHTGEALIGVVTNGEVRDYVVLGDTVNIVSRMDDICSRFNKKLILSETTYKSVDNFIQADYAGSIKLRGKDVQVALYVPKLGKDID